MSFDIQRGDCLDILRTMPDESVQCCVTSPPYWGLRDYGVAGQLGLERTPEEYVAKMVEVFREVRRVLRKDGTCFLNLGDSYCGGGNGAAHYPQSSSPKQLTNFGSTTGTKPNGYVPPGLKAKDLVGIPWMVAFALRSDGWYLRQDIIWAKPNPMPESVRDRCTKSHEYIFLLSKSERYYYDSAAIAEAALYADDNEARYERALTADKSLPTEERNGICPRKSDKQRGHGRRHAGFNDRWDLMEKKEQCSGTRNKRSVWNIGTHAFPEAHFATFPPEIPEICIKAGTKEGDTVLDPFNGAGTTGLVATRLMRNYIGIELNPEYVTMSNNRIVDDSPLFNTQIEQG